MKKNRTDGDFVKAKPKKKNFFKKHLKLIIFLVILIIAGIVALYFYRQNKMRSLMESAENDIDISTVERMDISNSVAVTGSIVANETRNVSTLVSNIKVISVSVNVGDYVKKGDPICSFDKDAIVDRIERLQKQMYVTASKAKINEMEANTKLAWTLQDAYETAQAQQERVAAAVRAYDAAERNLGEAEKQLEEAQEDYDDDDSDENERALRQAELSVASAKDSVASAVDSYNDAVRSQVDDAENSTRTVSQNQETIITTDLDNTTTNDSAETELTDLETQLENCDVTAPIDGIVTSISVSEGDEYNEKSTICVIQDDSVYKVSGTVDQYDISSIEEGMQAVIKTDATGDEELTGKVTFVAPVPVSSSSSSSTTGSSATSSTTSSTSYEVEITLDYKAPELRLGMTAESSIIIDKRSDVLAVPYDCVETDDDGNSYVYLVEHKKRGNDENDENENTQADPAPVSTKKVQVEVGLETDYYMEIISDEIKEGDQVLVPDGISENPDMQFGGFGGMGGGMPGGRGGRGGGGPR